MSQRTVEWVIGRLVTDEAFRRRFAADPASTLAEVATSGGELTACESRVLADLDARAVERCAGRLDPRLLKADLAAAEYGRTDPGRTGTSNEK